MLAPVTGFLALFLTAVALPPLLARLTGGHAPRPGPQLAALAPVATLPALAAVALAAASAWWLAVLLAVPAAILLAWQLPPFLLNASARPADLAPVPGVADGHRYGPGADAELAGWLGRPGRAAGGAAPARGGRAGRAGTDLGSGAPAG